MERNKIKKALTNWANLSLYAPLLFMQHRVLHYTVRYTVLAEWTAELARTFSAFFLPQNLERSQQWRPALLHHPITSLPNNVYVHGGVSTFRYIDKITKILIKYQHFIYDWEHNLQGSKQDQTFETFV